MRPSVAVVILNWNGKHHLERFLPLVIDRTPEAQIIVADGASSDGSVSWINKNHANVQVIDLKENFGFAEGYNRALEEVDTDIFILLNSDVEVTMGWLKPLIDQLQASPLNGACQPKILSHADPTTFEHAGAAGGFMDRYGFPFCRGRIFDRFEKDNGQYDSIVPVFWATGTCLAIKKDVWVSAGGFDADLFAHMEEIDLCWRIHRAGYQVHAVPDSSVLHIGGGTLPYKHPRKTYLNFRNSLIVLTKNAPGPTFFLIFKRFLLDGAAAWKFLLQGKPKHYLAVANAHIRYMLWLPNTLNKRASLKQKFPTMWPRGTYKHSIAWQYFLRGKETFSELDDRPGP
jgi:GT2 family glycosyltransferase